MGSLSPESKKAEMWSRWSDDFDQLIDRLLNGDGGSFFPGLRLPDVVLGSFPSLFKVLSHRHP